MSFLKSYINAFILMAIAIVVSACVPKATEKKAACGVNQAFSSVTRSCYSIEELRYKPVATKASETMAEETPKTITLTYTDANKDQAISCKISGISSNIDVISPVVTSNGIFDQADDVYAMANNLATVMPMADAAAAATAASSMLTALNSAKNSFYYATVMSKVGDFVTQVNLLLTLAGNHPADLNVKNYSTLTQSRLAELTPMITQMSNRCECSGGVCTAVVVPKINKSGSASFSYSVTDADGESASKSVAISISAMSTSTSHLRPVAASSYVTLSESATSAASNYSVTLPAAGDLAGTSLSAFRYYFNGTKNGSNQGVTTKGKVTGCMDLTGSTGLTDTSCIYTPTSGDDNETVIVTTAGVTVGDVTFSALTHGTYGNSFSIQYFDLQSNLTSIDPYASDLQKFGLVSSTYNESYVRVVGNAIKVFINTGVTTSANIRDLVNNHPQAKYMVLASGGSGALPDPSVLTLTAQSFAGGTDAFDTIPFTVNNSLSTSTNAANVMVKMSPVNDAPMAPRSYNSLFAQTETFLEGQTKAISFGFSDVDDTAGFTVAMKVDTTIPTCTNSGPEANITNYFNTLVTSTNFNINAPGAISCTAGACSFSANIDALGDFSGSACLYYEITDSSTAKSYVQGIGLSVTNVNDTPQLSLVALPTITPLAADTINEDLAAGLDSSSDIYVGPAGGVWEASQLLTITATSSNTTLIPNTVCKNYTIGTATPIGTVIPSATGTYYFDKTNYVCYVSTGSATSNDWALYPSLTVFPTCAYNYYGQGSPVGVVTPAAMNNLYLDTTNNKCYKAGSTSSSSWALDPDQSHYKVIYVPAKDKSGTANITINVKDNGGTANAATDNVSDVIALTVNSINDPPVFLASITNIQTNEGGAVQSDGFQVDEDEGSTTDEDAQGISITSITTDNAAVLPSSAITIFYDLNDNGVEDSGELRAVGATLEAAAANDAKAHKFYLKLDPVDGIDGNSNVIVTISDGTSTASKSFSFVVHPIAALHGGWANISSIGIKTDKNGAPVSEAEIQCNYNKSTDAQRCGAGVNCTGTSSPHSLIVPTAANVIFWDSSNKRCYRSTSTSEYSWVEHKTSCPITRNATACSGNNCIIAATPVGSLVPTAVGQYVFDSTNNACYVSNGTTNADWEVYVPSKVTLAWKPFTLVGSGPESGVQVAGWNVYRREADADYNLKGGHLKDTNSNATFTITDPSTRTFTDTTAIAGKMYYYSVRPVDNRRNFPTYTPEMFSEVRVLASPANYSFVHRWIVNQEICNGMNITTATTPYHVDQSNNFRCEYFGPGDNGSGYYDYGRDLLVDTQELGCPYAAAPKCSANGCVGIGAPSVTGAPLAADDLYYDRGAGVCYRYTGAAWTSMESAAVGASLADKLRSALNAPLVNITQPKAATICSTRPVPSGTDLTFTATNAILPSKKDYNAYASHKINITDPEITELEQGFSLNVQSRCNSSAASGIETAYTDSSIPSTSFIYSIPGTAASNIRSIYTGSIPWGSSKGTEACVSRFGIQDLYGNVAEWTTDKMSCASGFSCIADITASYYGYVFGGADRYAFDLKSGPYNDADGSGTANVTDAFLTSWTFTDELFSAGKFSYPIGLPINVDIESVFPTSTALDWLLDIGPSSGITTNKLHEDGIIVNGEAVNDTTPNATQTGAFAVGGSYLSGNLAGRFSSELVPLVESGSDIGLRCIVPIDDADYPTDSKHTYPY